MAPPPPSPARSYTAGVTTTRTGRRASSATADEDEDDDTGSEDSGDRVGRLFSIPKTPKSAGMGVARRASFKFLASSLGKKRKE